MISLIQLIDDLKPGEKLARVNKRGVVLYIVTVESVERNGWGDLKCALLKKKDGSLMRKTRGFLTDQYMLT